MPEQLTHWKKTFDPNYLGTYALKPGEILVATVDHVEMRDVFNPARQKEESKTVLFFREKDIKPMILNNTNCKAISKVAGSPYMEQWSGVKIQIHTEVVKVRGETTDGLRVIPERVKDEPPIPCEVCGNPIKAAYSMTAKQFAELSKQRTGKRMCAECANKAKEEKPNATV